MHIIHWLICAYCLFLLHMYSCSDRNIDIYIYNDIHCILSHISYIGSSNSSPHNNLYISHRWFIITYIAYHVFLLVPKVRNEGMIHSNLVTVNNTVIPFLYSHPLDNGINNHIIVTI